MSIPEAVRKLEARVADGREQTMRADTKAQIVAAGVAAVAAATVATGTLTGLPLTAAIPAWGAVAAMVTAVVALGVVLWPRSPKTFQPNTEMILAWAHHDAATHATNLAREAAIIETIRDRKFRLLRIALALLGLAGILAGIAALAAAIGS